MPQWAAKLQAVKILVLEKSKVVIGGAVFMWQYDVWKEKCNFWKMKKVWQSATLVSLEIQEHVLPFQKPPIKIC